MPDKGAYTQQGAIVFRQRAGGTGNQPLIPRTPDGDLVCKAGDPVRLVNGQVELLDADTTATYGIAAHEWPLSIIPDGDDVKHIMVTPATSDTVFALKTVAGTDFTEDMIGTTRQLANADSSGDAVVDISQGGEDHFHIDGLMEGYNFGDEEVYVYGRFVENAYES